MLVPLSSVIWEEFGGLIHVHINLCKQKSKSLYKSGDLSNLLQDEQSAVLERKGFNFHTYAQKTRTVSWNLTA